jgi:hypothetical protein
MAGNYRWKYYDLVVSIEGEVWGLCFYDGMYVSVSNYGRVYTARHKITYGAKAANYLNVKVNGKSVMVHRLVCMSFKPIANPEYYVVNHIDNNGNNNHINNLEWVTKQQNAIHAMQFVTNRRGSQRVVLIFNQQCQLVYRSESLIKTSELMKLSRNRIMNCCKNGNLDPSGFYFRYEDLMSTC